MTEAEMEQEMTRFRILNRDVIKYAAMAAMLVNHIANIFLIPGTWIYTVLVDIGYFTAPVMCYFLTEGYVCTRSKKRYALRLAVFALISEIPFCLAFSEAFYEVPGITFCGFNMIFTLLLCFGILAVREYVPDIRRRMILISGLFLLSMFSDWALLAPLFTLLFARAGRDRTQIKRAFAAGTALFALAGFMPGKSGAETLVHLGEALLAACGVALAGIVILYFYNGKRAARGRTFSKWFFYLFYPGHLLVLGIIRILFRV